MPALPLDEAGKYVAAAYLVFLTLLIVYVAIMGMKIARIEREIGELLELEEAQRGGRAKPGRQAEPGWRAIPSDREAGCLAGGNPSGRAGAMTVRRSDP